MAVINEENYHDEQNKNNILKLRKVLDTLPSFCRDFFRGIEPYTSTRTRLAYAYDIRLFFEFLHEKNSYCHKMEITEFPLSVLDMVQRTDIEEYLDYMSLYQKDGKNITNEERGKARKLAALRSFYNYYFQSERIEKNTAALVPLPKRHEKEIIRLEPNEVAILLDQVEDGTKLTKKELEYHKKTKLRDIALLTLLLGTGIRVSECVGLDINDVDFNNGGIKIRRKGGYEAIVYFGDEVETALLDYLEQREHIIPAEGHENALFLSLQNRRMAVRSVENLVKKYASRVTTLKKITPHKLRSTYGTELYKETGDIYLVADVLGHKDVNTTRKHYAALEEQRRRQAANAFHLREHSNRHSDQPDKFRIGFRLYHYATTAKQPAEHLVGFRMPHVEPAVPRLLKQCRIRLQRGEHLFDTLDLGKRIGHQAQSQFIFSLRHISPNLLSREGKKLSVIHLLVRYRLSAASMQQHIRFRYKDKPSYIHGRLRSPGSSRLKKGHQQGRSSELTSL